MIKLVSQFDNENSKLSLATPTCGACCCCCCCCIITTIVTASISGRNFGRYLAKLDKEKTKQKYIVPKIILRFIGYFVYVLASLIAMFCLLDNGFNKIATHFRPISSELLYFFIKKILAGLWSNDWAAGLPNIFFQKRYKTPAFG